MERTYRRCDGASYSLASRNRGGADAAPWGQGCGYQCLFPRSRRFAPGIHLVSAPESRVMSTGHDPNVLPGGLPVPQDDGATVHLTGLRLPSVPLAGTDGARVDLSRLAGRTLVYIYPRTG